MRIAVSKCGTTHYHAMCHNCDWEESVGGGLKANDVRREALRHVRTTQHMVSIEEGVVTQYRVAKTG